jgi:hypothetical protein
MEERRLVLKTPAFSFLEMRNNPKFWGFQPLPAVKSIYPHINARSKRGHANE